jgi:uncharacterized protein YcaQ
MHSITNPIRRRFILGKQGLWPGRRWSGKTGVSLALLNCESIQVDPVSIIAQSHDLALWGRVNEYQPAYLNNLMYQDRQFFDYGGELFIYPMTELPYWRVMMERRKAQPYWADFAQAHASLLDEVRQTIHQRGPLRKRDFDGKAVKHYRASKDSGVALHYLWLTGELMTYSRQGKERVYDFLENTAPAHLQWQASEAEAIEFFTRKAISHHGMVSDRDFRNILKSISSLPIDANRANQKLAAMVESGRLRTTNIEKQTLYYLTSDASLLEALTDELIPAEWQPIDGSTREEVTFLSPLDYVSARGRAKELFSFEYIWEIYKPAIQRQYGPYTLPVLFGDQLVARMDAKYFHDRKSFCINGLWTEPWFSPGDSFSLAFAKGLLRLVMFLGAQNLEATNLLASLHRQVSVLLPGHGISIKP